VVDQQKRQVKLLKAMAKKGIYIHYTKPKKKRPGVHSKNASQGQTGYKKKYIGQGKTN